MTDPQPRITALTLGVRDFAASVRFYEALGFARKLRTTGDAIALFDAGGVVLALFRWDELAEDAAQPTSPANPAFQGSTCAWNCTSRSAVDAAFEHAVKAGAAVLKRPQKTGWGGYSGYFADPDGHAWEVVNAPGLPFSADGGLVLPD
jgi:hypothetical protein